MAVRPLIKLKFIVKCNPSRPRLLKPLRSKEKPVSGRLVLVPLLGEHHKDPGVLCLVGYFCNPGTSVPPDQVVHASGVTYGEGLFCMSEALGCAVLV